MRKVSYTIHARQAIVTRYHGPTNYRGSRVSAKAEAGRLTIEWDDALSSEDNHAAAVKALAHRLEWDSDAYTRDGGWHLGALPGGGYVAVLLTTNSRIV